MATINGRKIFQNISAAISATTTSAAEVTLYTVPAGKFAIINCSVICPTVDATSSYIAIRNGATNSNFFYGTRISVGVFATSQGPRNALQTRTSFEFFLGPGQIVRAAAGTGGTVNISGIEYQNTGP